MSNAPKWKELEDGIMEMKERFAKKVLWENNDSLENFNARQFTIDERYDYLIIYCYRNHTGDDKKIVTAIVEKNKSTEINYSDFIDGRSRAWSRQIEITNGVNINIGNATIEGSISNNTLIPYKILGCRY